MCAELGVGEPAVFSVRLRPGVRTGKAVEQLGLPAWHGWHMRWRAFGDRLPAGVEVVRAPVTVRGAAGEFPAVLNADLDGAGVLVGEVVDIGQARSLG